MDSYEEYSFPREDKDRIFVPLTKKEDYEKYIDTLFTGGIAIWAGRRLDLFGEYVALKQVYLEWADSDSDPHKVAWIEHYGQDMHTEFDSLHHVICDCAGHSSEQLPELCIVAENALLERADLTSRNWHIPETLALYQHLDVSDYQRNEEFNDLLLKTMENILITDRNQPEVWVGNIVSGEHQVSLMSRILKQPEDSVRLCAEILQLQDKLEIEGDTFRLAA